MTILKKHKYWHALEVIPGAISWTALLAPIFLSIYIPTVVAFFVLAYAIMWMFRSFSLAWNLLKAYQNIHYALCVNWRKKMDLIEQSKDIWHAIVFVTYKEGWDVIEPSIRSYAEADFPHERMVVIFAGEEADKAQATAHYERLKKEFAGRFKEMIFTVHPRGLPNEIPGKSANATYGAKQLQKYLDIHKIPYENVIVSNFDADTVAHPQYFAELTTKYCEAEDRTLHTYQPIHLYHNNIWDVPVLIRLVALSCSFWRMAESMDKERYKSFSSRSCSMKLLVDVDFWDPAVIPEDSRQYWTALFQTNGKHKLVSIWTPLYLDAVLADSYLKTFKNQYKQLRRWAWGVCDFPFVVLNLLKHKAFTVWQKIKMVLLLLESHFFWATAPFLITFTGWLPGIINKQFQKTVLAYTLPTTTSFILTLASIGLLTSMVVSLLLIPQKPHKISIRKTISLIAQWLFVPIVSIVLSAIPALDAQTRLMFGWRLDYDVTEKARAQKSSKKELAVKTNSFL